MAPWSIPLAAAGCSLAVYFLQDYICIFFVFYPFLTLTSRLLHSLLSLLHLLSLCRLFCFLSSLSFSSATSHLSWMSTDAKTHVVSRQFRSALFLTACLQPETSQPTSFFFFFASLCLCLSRCFSPNPRGQS